MIKIQINILMTLVTIDAMTLIILLKNFLTFYQKDINFFRKLISTHGACHSDTTSMLKILLLNPIIFNNIFSLVFNPKFQTFYVIVIFTDLFTLVNGSLVCYLKRIIKLCLHPNGKLDRFLVTSYRRVIAIGIGAIALLRLGVIKKVI